jgi:hypothetical protein
MRLSVQTRGGIGRNPAALLRHALALPRSVARALRPTDNTGHTPEPATLSTEILRDRLSLTIIAGHPDRAALAEYVKPSILEWQAHDWEGLGQRLTRLDRRHSTLPSGDRTVPALGQALFRHIVGATVRQMIDRGQTVTTTDLPEDLFAPLTRALGRDDTAPAVHFLAAQFNLETGWARRGDDYGEFAGDDALFAARARFGVARNILDRIAAKAPHSAYFAEMDYRVRAAEGCTEDDLTRAAIRWSRTDPTSLTPFAVHGVHLLPRWYGDSQSLATYADRVWAKTHETLGAAGYSTSFLSAIEQDPTALQFLDPRAFREGLIDMMQQSDDPDVTCNAILRVLWEVSSDGYGTDGRDPTALRRARHDLRDTFAYLVRHTLGPVMPDVWGRNWSEPRILHALAEAFADEIGSGKSITIGMDGVRISDEI